MRQQPDVDLLIYLYFVPWNLIDTAYVFRTETQVFQNALHPP